MEDTPRWVGTTGLHYEYTERSDRPWVTLKLRVMRRYNLGEGDLVSTIAQFDKNRRAVGVLFPMRDKTKACIEGGKGAR